MFPEVEPRTSLPVYLLDGQNSNVPLHLSPVQAHFFLFSSHYLSHATSI